ncbi:MAG TPA: gas vesicle protein GvpN [Ktedonobacteraceae bacterium]|jgi:gas vesicle protein GvpN|nr:gas vesicle protein GvpN [Ktedonobacteraceae bacterium]
MHKTEQGLSLSPSEGFVETPAIQKIVDRSLLYLQAGLPVHLTGPTGTGKSTLAMHLASILDRPVMLTFGDEEFATPDLIGDRIGYHRRKLIDNFIHSVLKTEEEVSERWVDNRLTTACREGLTFIYDEFNRSRPEANNALLSVLEEGVLTLPTSEEEDGYIEVHPNFRAIFTSNPDEYAGVHKTQDSLLDRMVTIHLDYFDEETERAIVVARTGIAYEDAVKIIKLLRDCRKLPEFHHVLSIRPAITIGKILNQGDFQRDKENPLLVDVCLDTLVSPRHDGNHQGKMKESVIGLIQKHF